MVSIPTGFDVESKEPFDWNFMNALYDFGYPAGRSGALWTRNPTVFWAKSTEEFYQFGSV
jgi:hypothetical protein